MRGPRRLVSRMRFGPAGGYIPASDKTIERAGVDVMHFTIQSAFLTHVPSIYHPHDLQHLHLPQYFDERQIRSRERLYRTMCERSEAVCVTSTWIKDDLIRHYQLPDDKVQPGRTRTTGPCSRRST